MDGECDEAGWCDDKEHESSALSGEAVHDRIHQGQGLEERVVSAVTQTHAGKIVSQLVNHKHSYDLLDCREEDSGIERVDLPGLDQSIKQQAGGLQVLLLPLCIRHEVLVTSFFTKALSLVV